MTERSCYGKLDIVFPVGKDGLRGVDPACFHCPERKDCLKEALSTKEGVEFRMELLDRFPAKGIVDRVRRWSERKALSRLREHGGKRK